MKRLLLALAATMALAPEAPAQNAITQEGSVLQNSPMMFRGNNRARQGAPVGGAPTGQIVTTGDAVVGGRCDYSAPIDASGGYAKLCINAKDGSIELGGTNPPTTLKIIINGTVYEVPLSAAIIGSDAVVGNNVALKALTGSVGKHITRLGFTAIGDGGIAAYDWSAANCTAPDDGAQVQPSTTGCWIMSPLSSVDVRVWGAVATTDGSQDAGPAIRAAAAYSAATGTTISVPAPKTSSSWFWLNTLDPSGLGALVTGLTPGPDGHKTVPNFVGSFWLNSPDECSRMPTFVLGNNLNRPLIYANNNSYNPYFSKMCLHGNRGTQSGWAGGPEGKLYTVQTADYSAATPETSITFEKVVIQGGYNGNLYHGGYRGLLFATDLWSIYSGQDTTDKSIMLNSYDAFFTNLQIGVNTGFGLWLNAGTNYIIDSFGIFMNHRGMFVAGQQVTDLQMSNGRFQAHTCGGIQIAAAPPLAGQVVAGHVYSNVLFQDNSDSGAGLCSDILAQNAVVDTFIAPTFQGSPSTTGKKPKYNFDMTAGGNIIQVVGTQTGTANPFTDAFASEFKELRGDYLYTPTWTPDFRGLDAPGTVAYTHRVGTWTRSAKKVHVSVSFNVSSFTGGVGPMIVGPLPFQASAVANRASSCSIGQNGGWIGPAGYTTLTGLVGINTNYIALARSGSGVTTAESLAGEWSTGTSLLVLTCSYDTDQ